MAHKQGGTRFEAGPPQSLGVKSQAQLAHLRPGATKRVEKKGTLEMRCRGNMEPALGEAGKEQALLSCFLG